MSPTRIVFTTPLYFGIAHVHHYYEFRLTHPDWPALPALLRSLFQFAYTSLFGFFAAFAFLRTGSLPAVVVAHALCNALGLPRFWGRVDRYEVVVEPGEPIGPQGADKKDDDADADANDGGSEGRASPTLRYVRLGVAWTVAYYILLVGGAVGFYHALFPLTESPSALAHFD